MKGSLLIALVCIACTMTVPQVQGDGSANRSQLVGYASANVCEIVKNGTGFDGKRVSVHAFVVGGIGHGFALADDHCKGGLSMDASESVREHDDYLSFLRTVVEQGGGFTEQSKSRLTATFSGVLSYRPKEHRKWVLDVERISDIEAKPNIDKPATHQ